MSFTTFISTIGVSLILVAFLLSVFKLPTMFNKKYHLLSVDSCLKRLNKNATKISDTPIVLINVVKLMLIDFQ